MIHTTSKHKTSQFINVMDTLLNNAFSDSADMHIPLVNIIEQEKDYQIELIAPAIQKENFKMTVEGDQLIITANLPETTEEIKFIKRGFAPKGFKRSFKLNKNLNPDSISAQYENGVLKVLIAKVNPQPVVSKEIAIN